MFETVLVRNPLSVLCQVCDWSRGTFGLRPADPEDVEREEAAVTFAKALEVTIQVSRYCNSSFTLFKNLAVQFWLYQSLYGCFRMQSFEVVVPEEP